MKPTRKRDTEKNSQTVIQSVGRSVSQSVSESISGHASLQYRRIFGKRTLSTSSRNLKAEEGWGEIDNSTKEMVEIE